MIGNDIVDLRQARRESNWQRPRYLNKLFSEQEQKWIARSKVPDTLVWLFWSSKEAAYKQWAAEQQQRAFIPRKIVVKSWQSTGEGNYQSQLTIGSFVYVVQSNVTETYIHSWTVPRHVKAISKQVFVTNAPSSSQAVRDSVIQYLSSQHAWSTEDLQVQTDVLGKPAVYHNKQLLPLSLSLSHHGGYGAFALVPTALARERLQRELVDL